MNRNRVLVTGAVIGGLIGAILFLPLGHAVVDGGANCTGCGNFTITLSGFRFREPVPLWQFLIGPVVGALLGLLVAWGIVRRRRA